jgi:hypothetical protein
MGDDLAGWASTGHLGQIDIHPVRARYDSNLAVGYAPPAPFVLVGVDDIPTRWVVQETWPKWLGIGATTHYSAMASFHAHGLACAHCLHPYDEPGNAPLPTAAFVSHWAGLWLASLFVRARGGEHLSPAEQSIFHTPLRGGVSSALWRQKVPRRSGCALNCTG